MQRALPSTEMYRDDSCQDPLIEVTQAGDSGTRSCVSVHLRTRRSSWHQTALYFITLLGTARGCAERGATVPVRWRTLEELLGSIAKGATAKAAKA